MRRTDFVDLAIMEDLLKLVFVLSWALSLRLPSSSILANRFPEQLLQFLGIEIDIRAFRVVLLCVVEHLVDILLERL